jgi:hypothetical protein
LSSDTERVPAAGTVRNVESLARHLRYSLRQIRRQPGVAATVVLTLALAIGANSAIFSFVNALLIRPFPFRDSEQLVGASPLRVRSMVLWRGVLSTGTLRQG